ncbi:Methyltransferase FkbM [Prochlorococcus marinus str. MIT 9321]|uniref:FkbM family methyltransferase n=2 Tax=Prochlorococcaceae TaxID=2881426 RepID=UPI00053399CF|nr:FkbM family methyltransferase [Prochlorococcus marinus]KGG02861.1 Methyltransferase FkbM [Prochlorococcus marinus str. MIT 9321]KGG05484.1 Methyltransferase FkbM [Prochlorococcus marinus str. MIT 9322]
MNTYPSLEHYSVLKSLKEKKINFIVDVGANKGQFSLMANYFFPEAKIFAFEPLKQPALTFKNIFLNNKKIELIQFGISSYKAEKTIYETNKNDSSSFLSPNQLNKKYFSIRSKQKYKVPTITLNDWVSDYKIYINKKNSLLKIDVQGFELEVLSGANIVLNKFGYLIVELSSQILYDNQPKAESIIDFLVSNNFYLKKIYNKVFDNSDRLIQADYLFKNEKID